MKFQAVIITTICLTLVCGSRIIFLRQHTPEENPKETCAFNGKIFSYIYDKCLMINDNCRFSIGAPWLEVPMWLCFNDLNAQKQHKCNRILSEDINPVCAVDGNRIQIFPTLHHIGMENCLTNNRWIETDFTLCKGKETNNNRFIIPKHDDEDSSDVLSPICAIEKETLRRFEDKCEMLYDSCDYHREWTPTNMTLCEEEEIKSRCYVPCDRLYRPICGFNGKKKKLFDNKCIFSVENCISGWKWEELNRYDCPK